MARPTGGSAAGSPGLTIEQLARTVGMTPRNVRAYQARGLMPPPTRHGRTGYYDGTHVSRLMLVRELQERGLNLAAVQALLDSREIVTWLFHDVRERAREPGGAGPVTLPSISLTRLRELDPETPDELCRRGILHRDGEDTYTVDAALFMAALRLIEADVPLSDVVRALVQVGEQGQALAREVGRTLARHAGEPAGTEPTEDLAATLVPYAVQMCVAGLESLLSAAVPDEVRRARTGSEVNLRSTDVRGGDDRTTRAPRRR